MVAESKSGLEAVEVTKVFGDLTALDRVSLAVEPGEIHGLVGHNGAGKSTLLRVLAGVVRPERGHLRISGKDIYAPCYFLRIMNGTCMVDRPFYT